MYMEFGMSTNSRFLTETAATISTRGRESLKRIKRMMANNPDFAAIINGLNENEQPIDTFHEIPELKTESDVDAFINQHHDFDDFAHVKDTYRDPELKPEEEVEKFIHQHNVFDDFADVKDTYRDPEYICFYTGGSNSLKFEDGSHKYDLDDIPPPLEID